MLVTQMRAISKQDLMKIQTLIVPKQLTYLLMSYLKDRFKDILRVQEMPLILRF